MAQRKDPRKSTDVDRSQVRDQDAVPQGDSGEKNWTGQKETPRAPGAHSIGQGAHDYSNQDRQVRKPPDNPAK